MAAASRPDKPSMVVTWRFPTADTGKEQDRSGLLSRNTVQAPHMAMPQPNFVPVRPRLSRSTHNSGVSGKTSTPWLPPLILRLYAVIVSSRVSPRASVTFHGTASLRGQIAVKHGYNLSALANGGGNTFDRPGPDIADGKNTFATRLEELAVRSSF